MYNAGVSHELLPGTSVTAEWFHSSFKNLIARNNVLRTAADYTLINVVSPIDNSLIPFYNVSAAKQSAVQNVDSNDPNMSRSYNGLEINVNARLPHGIRMFGGTSTEKTVSNSCSAASTDPNLLLYCDGSKNGIPWVTAGKIAGTVPLPWYGITFSGSLQALAGIPIGTAPVQYSVFTAGSGFNQPNGLGSNLLISRTTRYPANCAAPCTPNGLMIPGLTPASINLGLVAPGTEFTPRINQVDFGLSKTIRTRQRVVDAEARSVQRAQLRRLHRGGVVPVQRGDLPAAVGRAAGTHRARRRRREVVGRPFRGRHA